jgi:hypothetical protein
MLNRFYQLRWVVLSFVSYNEKSRCNLFDGYAYVNGQRSGGGEYGTILSQDLQQLVWDKYEHETGLWR